MTLNIDLMQPLEWDTQFWGVAAARIHANTPDELAAADIAAVAAGIEWSSMLVPSTNTELLTEAAAIGHRIVDFRLELRMKLDERWEESTVALAGPSDVDELCEIARTAFVLSRFYKDVHLDRTRCDEFYELWLRNSLAGSMGDEIVVVSDGDRIVGFVTLRMNPDTSCASLPLVAVHPSTRGKGVGNAMLTTAMGWLRSQGHTEISVVTQLSNLPAVRLYESIGFRSYEAATWTHRWYGDAL